MTGNELMEMRESTTAGIQTTGKWHDCCAYMHTRSHTKYWMAWRRVPPHRNIYWIFFSVFFHFIFLLFGRLSKHFDRTNEYLEYFCCYSLWKWQSGITEDTPYNICWFFFPFIFITFVFYFFDFDFGCAFLFFCQFQYYNHGSFCVSNSDNADS